MNQLLLLVAIDAGRVLLIEYHPPQQAGRLRLHRHPQTKGESGCRGGVLVRQASLTGIYFSGLHS